MTTKEKIIHEAIKRISKRIIKIDEVLNADPIKKIIEIRQEAQKLLEENQGFEKRISNTFQAKFGKLAKEEKRQIRIFENQTSRTSCLIEEKVKIENELGDLQRELYYIN